MKYFLVSGSGHRCAVGETAPVYSLPDHGWITEIGTVTASPGEYSVDTEIEVPVEVGNLKPSPMEFLLLLTLVEQAGIRAAAPSDPQVAILVSMVDDTRLTFVDLTHPTVVEAIQYLAGKPALLTADRVARVLAGLPPKAAA